MEDIYLKHPVTLGERKVTELHFQEPCLMHMMRTDGHDINDVGADIALVSALTGEPEDIIKVKESWTGQYLKKTIEWTKEHQK